MLALSVMALLTIAPVPSQAQEELQAAAPAPQAVGQSWNVMSRSSTTVYMVDVNAIKQQDGITTIFVARVPAQGEASDKTHSLTEVNLRCNANQSKTGTEIYYGADGSEEERIPNDYPFEAIAANSLDSYVKSIVCDNDRTTATFDSIEAFIAAGRPNTR
ncbi:hypothetical protein [Brevundimonas sp.]|uniref:hypothetical protein n=1 Tax=Brevundimonas sp. TaxID=1871086 RepID=UPI002FCC3249